MIYGRGRARIWIIVETEESKLAKSRRKNFGPQDSQWYSIGIVLYEPSSIPISGEYACDIRLDIQK